MKTCNKCKLKIKEEEKHWVLKSVDGKSEIYLHLLCAATDKDFKIEKQI